MVKKAPEKQPALSDKKEAPQAAPRTPSTSETPEQQKARLLREQDVEKAKQEEQAEQELLKIREQRQKATGENPPSAPETKTDVESNAGKTAFEKFGDVMNKMGEMVQKFFRQIQSMGSVTLRGMAATLSMLGFKKPAEWLNEMAGADHAELVAALRKGNLSLAAISPDDPDAKAKSEAAERGQSQLADRFKVLVQTRGPAFTREMYYSETVREWKKKSGNGSKTEVTHNDLLDMAVVAQELRETLPGQVAQATEFVSPLESLPAPLNVMGGAPVKVTVLRDKTIGLQAGPNGEILVSVAGGAPVRYRLSPNVDGLTGLAWQMRSMLLANNGLQIDGIATYQGGKNEYAPKLIPMTDVRAFLESVVKDPAGAPVVGTDFRFERV